MNAIAEVALPHVKLEADATPHWPHLRICPAGQMRCLRLTPFATSICPNVYIRARALDTHTLCRNSNILVCTLTLGGWHDCIGEFGQGARLSMNY